MGSGLTRLPSGSGTSASDGEAKNSDSRSWAVPHRDPKVQSEPRYTPGGSVMNLNRHASSSAPAEIMRRAPSQPPRARPGRDDVAGFAVIGLPFASGDLLCLRRFPATTFGPG